MIHKNLKIETLYINKYSGQRTYFFMRYNNKLYGMRSERSTEWKWVFGTWNSYANPLDTSDIGKLSKEELITQQRLALDGIFKSFGHNLVIQ